MLSATSHYFEVRNHCKSRKIFKSHKRVLVSQNLFKSPQFKDSQRPVIVFNDIKLVDMCAILNYAYTGYVEVQQEHLQSFFVAAYTLQMKGILRNEDLQGKSDQQPIPPQSVQQFLAQQASLQAQKDPAQSDQHQQVVPDPPANDVFLASQEQREVLEFSQPSRAIPKFTITPIKFEENNFQVRFFFVLTTSF